MIFMAAGFDPEAEVFWKEAAKLSEGGTGCVDEEFILAYRACIEEEIPEAGESIAPVRHLQCVWRACDCRRGH